jgi:ABC-type long-subunit fatty acid transport system fused permease/ATPase subunit
MWEKKYISKVIIFIVLLQSIDQFLLWFRTDLYGKFYSALESKDTVSCKNGILLLFCSYVIYCLFQSFSIYKKEKFILNIRNYCLLWLNSHWSNISVKNSSQKAEQDSILCVRLGIELLFDLSRGAWACIIFIPTLVKLNQISLVFVAVVYAIIGNFILRIVGKKLIIYDGIEEDVSAKMRMSFQSSEKIFESISQIYGVSRKIQKRKTILSLFVGLYQHFSYLIPFFVTIPAYFKFEITFGEMMQCSPIFGAIISGLSIFIEKYDSIAHFKVSKSRLYELEETHC